MTSKATSLSSSPIWQAQRDYYAKKGVDSWRAQVPFYATSNAYMAHTYLRLMSAFIADLRANHINQPVTIIELGAGSGQLSYLLLQQLSNSHDITPDEWRYVMTDAELSLINFWQSHPGFECYHASGQLDMMVWEIGDKIPSDIQAYCQQGPIIFIANYVFDSLPADVYRIQEEKIFPVFASIDNEAPVEDFSDFFIQYETQQALQTNDPILSHYRQRLLNTVILYPSSSLHFLASAKHVATHGCLVLCSDKAYVELDELDGLSEPELTPHDGCFSMMVNMDALSRWCQLHDGFSYLPSRRAGLKTALLGINLLANAYPQLHRVAVDCIDDFTPGQYLELYKSARSQASTLSLEAWASYLAMSHWDPMLFLHAYRHLVDQLDGADMLTIEYLLNHLDQVASQAYWLPFYQDIWFMLGVLCHQLKRYHQAAGYYQQSLQYYPGVFGVYFNLGVCQANCGLNQAAIKSFEAADQLEHDNERVRDWLDRLKH